MLAIALLSPRPLFATTLEPNCGTYLDLDLAPEITKEEGEVLVHLLNERLRQDGYEKEVIDFEFADFEVPKILESRHLKPHDWLLLAEETFKRQAGQGREFPGGLPQAGTLEQNRAAIKTSNDSIEREWFTYIFAYIRSTGRRALALNRLNYVPMEKTNEAGQMVRVYNIVRIPQILILPADQSYLDLHIELDPLEIFSSTAPRDAKVEFQNTGISFVGVNHILPTNTSNPSKPFIELLYEDALHFIEETVRNLEDAENLSLDPSDSNDKGPTLH